MNQLIGLEKHHKLNPNFGLHHFASAVQISQTRSTTGLLPSSSTSKKVIMYSDTFLPFDWTIRIWKQWCQHYWWCRLVVVVAKDLPQDLNLDIWLISTFGSNKSEKLVYDLWLTMDNHRIFNDDYFSHDRRKIPDNTSTEVALDTSGAIWFTPGTSSSETSLMGPLGLIWTIYSSMSMISFKLVSDSPVATLVWVNG